METVAATTNEKLCNGDNISVAGLFCFQNWRVNNNEWNFFKSKITGNNKKN